MGDRILPSGFVWWSGGCFAGRVRLVFLILAVGFCLIAVPAAQGQETVSMQSPLGTSTATDIQPVVTKSVPEKGPVAQEITFEGMVSYGDHKIFGAAERCNVWTAGVEYDRHMFGYHFKAQIDYVVEILPFVLLSQPTSADFWGNPASPYQELVPGLAVAPIGFRLLWRSGRKIKPYMIAKGGAVAFTKKALSPYATYLNYNWQGEFGVEFPLTDRMELRIGPMGYFHVSNGHMEGSNPGMDELVGRFGVSYHIGRRGAR
jgi:Lipid A 3-O-deacylase (PagL)